MALTWHIKTFEELSPAELYAILQLRAEIFVVEQDCVYQDIDGKDLASYHLFAVDSTSTVEYGCCIPTVVAYGRLIPPGISYADSSIGRVVTKETWRNRGLSREMMERGIAFLTQKLGQKTIRISGQYYIHKFYESLGFAVVSDIYLEDGIDHVEMLYRVT